LHEIDGSLALQADGFKLFRLEENIGVALDLVALDDVGRLDPAETGHGPLIFDPLAGRLVNLVEPDLGLRFNG